MLEDGFTFDAFLDFLVRVIKAIGYTNIFLIAWLLRHNSKKKIKHRPSTSVKFLYILGGVDILIRTIHAFSGRIIATRYYFVEAMLCIFPAVVGIILLRSYLCKKTSKNPVIIMSVLIVVITISQLLTIYKPRPHKEYIKIFAEAALASRSEVDYIYGDFPRINYYAGLTYRGFIRDATYLRNLKKTMPELNPQSIFLALKGDIIPKDYKELFDWKLLKEVYDHKNCKIVLFQASPLKK
jgi:hypothetical protein